MPAQRASRASTVPDSGASPTITLDARKVTRALAAVTVLLVVANLVAVLATYLTGRLPHDIKLAYLFYLDGERNFPTAFSTMLLLAAALLLTIITFLEWRQRGHSIPYWALLTVGFAFMGVDEAWSFHEKLSASMRELLGGAHLGAFYYAWVLPALVLVLVLGLVFLRFLWRLPAATRVQFIVAGAVYVGGAVGIEMIEGLYDEVHGDRNLVTALTATVQETLEMAGAILFIRALLGYLADRFGEVQLRCRRADDSPH
jgi:hypothetical protein